MSVGPSDGSLREGGLFSCLTCSLCDRRCPADVAYTELVRNLRERAFREGVEPECPHGGALQSVMRMMAKGGTQQDRLSWLGGDLKTRTGGGKVLYWTGCAMYYDAFFSDLALSTLDGVRSAVRLMNALGVEPMISPEERCCGHDLLWNGDRGNFDLLARHNVDLLRKSGADLLVTSCAECLRTWKIDYAAYFTGRIPRIVHITEFLSERLPDLKLRPDGTARVTYQDPCRLGRHLGIYDPPRRLLHALPGVSVAEMRRTGPAAICCAGGTWSHCDRFAKKIQVERLREARATGAETLVTACPKCQIHFRCAMKDPSLAGEIALRVRDVAELVSEALA
jgi:Fe-S oxidoreductase